MAGTNSKQNRANWGTVEPLPSGTYRARYTGTDGERYKAPHTFSTKTDARNWLATQQAAISNGTWRSPLVLEAERRARDAATFEKYARAWIAQRTTSNGSPLAPRTIHDYNRYLAKGLAQFATTPLDKFTPPLVRAWHADRQLKGATQAGQEARFLHAVLATAVKDELITRNPVDPKLTRSKAGRVRRDLTPEEVVIILDAIDERFKLAIILAAYGGLRSGEWRALRRKDITLTYDDDGTALTASVRVERQAQYLNGQGWQVGAPKSAEGVRTVHLPDWAAPQVAEHLGERVGEFPDSLIFEPDGSSEFVHDRQFRNAWDVAKAVAVLGDDVTPHSMRHHAGTQYAATGATIADIKARLGHSTFAAAMVYQHATNRDAELANKMPRPSASARPNVTKLPITDTVAG